MADDLLKTLAQTYTVSTASVMESVAQASAILELIVRTEPDFADAVDGARRLLSLTHEHLEKLESANYALVTRAAIATPVPVGSKPILVEVSHG